MLSRNTAFSSHHTSHSASLAECHEEQKCGFSKNIWCPLSRDAHQWERPSQRVGSQVQQAQAGHAGPAARQHKCQLVERQAQNVQLVKLAHLVGELPAQSVPLRSSSRPQVSSVLLHAGLHRACRSVPKPCESLRRGMCGACSTVHTAYCLMSCAVMCKITVAPPLHGMAVS